MSLIGILRSKGAAITFTKERASYDSGSDTMGAPPATVTVIGRAMGIGGPVMREPGTLVERATVTLAFRPDTAGEVPEDGSTCTWAGEEWSVRSTEPVAMNGIATGATVVLER